MDQVEPDTWEQNDNIERGKKELPSRSVKITGHVGAPAEAFTSYWGMWHSVEGSLIPKLLIPQNVR